MEERWSDRERPDTAGPCNPGKELGGFFVLFLI